VRTVRFHHGLYGGPALDEAAKVYERFATFARTEESPYWVFTVTADGDARERRIAGELANYALGLTVKQRSGSHQPPKR
jgi:hypothetical protein